MSRTKSRFWRRPWAVVWRNRRKIPAERIEITITDPEADVTFYLVYRTDNKTYADAFRRIAAAI